MPAVLEKDVALDIKVSVDYGLVSIVMPNYNCEKFIEETINSVIAQTYENWELLFVDDCSTDNSVERVKSFDDSRIRILLNDTNHGAAYSRNKALREAKGKWIAFLDSDDIWSFDKLEKQLDFMVKNQYDFTYTEYAQIDENSKAVGVYVSGPRKISRRKMFCYDYVGCLTVMYNAEVVGLIQVEECLKKRNDYAMWLKAIKKSECYCLTEQLGFYRVRLNSLSHSGLSGKLKNQYRMFRVGENMGAIRSVYHTGVNMFYGVLKKMFYEKKEKATSQYSELKEKESV